MCTGIELLTEIQKGGILSTEISEGINPCVHTFT